MSAPSWNDTPTASVGTQRKRFSAGFGLGTGNSSVGNTGGTWKKSNVASSSSTQSPSKSLNRAPSIESQRSIATAVSSLFRRATRRSGSSRGHTSTGEMGQDDYYQEYDLEQPEVSSIYSRPSFSSAHRHNFPYSSVHGSLMRGMSRQLSNDSLVSVGTGVGSVAGSVAGSTSVAGFPSHLQIHVSHSTLGLGSGVPPSPSSISPSVDIRTLSLSRRMLGTYASSVSSRTTSRSNRPPSSFHLRHTTSNATSSHSAPGPSTSHATPSQPVSISALVRERSHEDDLEDDEYTYGYDDTDEKKPTSPSGPKPSKSAAALRAEIEAVEAEGRKMFDAFNALELSVLTRGGKMHVNVGSSLIGPVPEETSIAVDAISIKSAKSGSGKDKGGSSASTSGMSGSTGAPTIASSSMTASTSTSATTNTTTHTAATSITSAFTSSNSSLSPPHPILHSSHSSPSLLNSVSTPNSKSRSNTPAHQLGTPGPVTPSSLSRHPAPAIPISSPPKKRPSILLQRRKTKVVLPPSIVAASLEIKEREREKEEKKTKIESDRTSNNVPTLTPDRPSTRVRTRSHSRERPAREKPPPSLQAQQTLPPPIPPIPPLSLIPQSSTSSSSYSKHPYADTSLALSDIIPDSDTPSQHPSSSQPRPSLSSPTSLPSLAMISSLTDELSTIRQRRATVTKRYDRRLEFLRAKLKTAELREMLK